MPCVYSLYKGAGLCITEHGHMNAACNGVYLSVIMKSILAEVLFCVVMLVVLALPFANYFLLKRFDNGRNAFIKHHIVILLIAAFAAIILRPSSQGDLITGLFLIFVCAYLAFYEGLLFLQLIVLRIRRAQYYYITSGILLIISLSFILAYIMLLLSVRDLNFKFG